VKPWPLLKKLGSSNDYGEYGENGLDDRNARKNDTSDPAHMMVHRCIYLVTRFPDDADCPVRTLDVISRFGMTSVEQARGGEGCGGRGGLLEETAESRGLIL
jgi:hypothetical protein